MSKRNKFDGGEIRFVADNMTFHTRHYVEAAQKAAYRRSRNKRMSPEQQAVFRTLSDKMKRALKTQPSGWFDSAILNAEEDGHAD